MSDQGQQRPQPAPAVTASAAYCPQRHPAPADLRLDGNEGPAPTAKLMLRLGELSAEQVRRYPDARALEGLIARREGLSPERVIVTAGADDAIERAVRAVVAPGREAIVTEPTFEMLPRYAARCGGDLKQVPWMEGAFPVGEVIAAVTERTALIAVVSPNNPTGAVATAADLGRLAAAAPKALLLVDLAYGEFADDDLMPAALSFPNALVVRTLSKAWGLAGLRVGWAAGPAEVIGWMRAVGQPYAIAAPSLQLAAWRLESGGEEMRAFVERVRAEREELSGFLRGLGARVIPSQANFLLARFKDALWVRDALAGQGVAVRLFTGQPALQGWLRIALPGDPEKLARLMRACEVALRPEAILFDIDDTLADVTASYRQATIATGGSFGVALTMDDITVAKAAGDANNDWELTWRLILGCGVEAPYDEVKERFERFYQGAEGSRGFRFAERLMLGRGELEALSERYRLGIVTGRPRCDAMTFLTEQGIEGLFGAIVTMDDGPLKPDPMPVRLAMERLGAERAWMIGDTPDDVRAARAAGALPIGVIAPADDPTVARLALYGAGAARVFTTVNEVMEVIP